MAPRASTRVRPAAKAAPATNGATAAPAVSKKRKAAEAEPEAKPAPAKKTRARNLSVKELDEAIKDIEPAKKASKTVAAKAAKVSQPSAKRASPATTAFDPEPKSTLANWKSSPPKTTSLPVINQAPTEVLTICVFGTGDMSGDLGLGPKKKVSAVPAVIPELDGREGKNGKYRVVQVACGGMHSLALTEDSKIVTWGGNDEGALGRNSAWAGGLRDMDQEKDKDGDDDASDSDSEGEALNPIESTPTHIPESSFPAGTKFTSVAAGDSCSFAVTDTGVVYGWGTFAVSTASIPDLLRTH